jgi:hypothetical protein
MIVRAPGYKTVTTHIFDATSKYLDSNTVFAVKPSLLRTFEQRSAEDPDHHQRSRGSGSRSRTTSCWSPETITARWLIRGGPRSRVVFRRNALRPRA